ncbi:MAG TPA: tRNA (adenosine(37)-N6)-threonylcarbamoyltransferase complex ATPase subunit type 1 TsaE [Candidatus Magasanikbacteria bacterium]|nr:tRNA (adenosine(37)-N6)-threonylcarbamoyltransferase complex ATPase subunit type 1 TsaE [Candidatus Magasanikbacteria bacterium]
MKSQKKSIVHTKTTTEMVNLGKDLSSKLHGGDVVLLYGEMGAGKSTLTKGIAQGLGIKKNVASPTFTLMNIYNIKITKSKIRRLVHIDTYRLKNEAQLIEIGATDYLGDPETICIIEWPEKVSGLLKDYKTKKIVIEHDGDSRTIKT